MHARNFLLTHLQNTQVSQALPQLLHVTPCAQGSSPLSCTNYISLFAALAKSVKHHPQVPQVLLECLPKKIMSLSNCKDHVHQPLKRLGSGWASFLGSPHKIWCSQPIFVPSMAPMDHTWQLLSPNLFVERWY